MTEKQMPPKHLSAESRRWFSQISSDYELESHHLKLLQGAAECWDRAQEARKLLAKDGVCFTDRHGHIRPHPATQMERDNKTLFARLVRELALDIEEPGDNKPPMIRGNSSRRSED